MGAVARVPAGQITGCPETRALLWQAMREFEVVARARGVLLGRDLVPQTWRFASPGTGNLCVDAPRPPLWETL